MSPPLPPPDSLPRTVALIDDDPEYAEFLAQYLREQGCEVTWFPDSDDFLVSEGAYGYDFYLVDLTLPGIDGVDLMRLLRRRTGAGIVAVSGRVGATVFDSVLTAGADMYLAKPVRFEQVLLAIRSVWRRSAAPAARRTWRLDDAAKRLWTPDGVAIDLSETDVTVLRCFADSADGTVSRATLCERLGRAPGDDDTENWLHATIYRLRRRIERATDEVVPLQSQPKVGYIFRGSLRRGDGA